jgi:hypothetical protein
LQLSVIVGRWLGLLLLLSVASLDVLDQTVQVSELGTLLRWLLLGGWLAKD